VSIIRTIPVGELKTLLDMQLARQQVIQANILARKGQLEPARSLLSTAVGRASNWPRVWIRAARVAEPIEEPLLAVQYLTVAFSQNPLRVQTEIGNGDYAELGPSPRFQKWVNPEQRERASAGYEHWSEAREQSTESRMQLSRTLLEIGYPDEALAVLNAEPPPADFAVEFLLLRSIAYEAKGDYPAAIEQCKTALAKTPDQSRIRRRIERFELQQAEISKQP
jgi:tetratricopeptide (TPR) repeat protein